MASVWRATCVCVLLTGSARAQALDHVEVEDTDGWEIPHRLTQPPLAQAKPIAAVDDLMAQAHPGADGRFYVERGDASLKLTVDPKLQQKLTQYLVDYETPYAAVVAMEPATGRVLAMAEYSHQRPDLRGLCSQALYPAASIFKIVTAAALLSGDVKPETSACFHGGKRHLTEALLTDSKRDGRCFDLSNALAFSANVVFAKFTARYLDTAVLELWANAFRFNRAWNTAVPIGVSKASIPEERFDLAMTGAGFGDVYMSPLHGAAMASAVANGGVWQQPVFFERDVAPKLSENPADRVLSPEKASALTNMMELTVTKGTARRIFRERGYRVQGAVGKTGSLADKKPFRDYSWFIGFAPKEAPQVAVAAVVVNEPKWRIRATWLGREAMRLGLESLNRAAKYPEK
ncbi:MAG: penicillin-binding protein [Myxococcaceae bacterium]|nr:penicillin-binding protein [Myxococcaceae bacterium]